MKYVYLGKTAWRQESVQLQHLDSADCNDCHGHILSP